MNNSVIRRPFQYRYFNATFILIGVNVLVYLLTNISRTAVFYLAMNPGMVLRGGAIWQLITYMFAHANLTHILFNMLGLFFFGVQVERRMGSVEFLLFYFVSGIGAGLFSLFTYVLTGSYGVILLGASGAVFAVLLAFATYFPHANIYIMGILPIRAPILVLIYTGIELFSSIASVRSGVAHLTHLAGFGFAFIYFMVRLGINPVKEFIDGSRY
jgi:membrane associated rhomboid family serine protease